MSRPTRKDPLTARVDRIAAIETLDALAGVYGKAAEALPERAKRFLQGESTGHPLHPMLTDLPIGFWTSAFVLDIVGGRRGAPMARRLVGLGVLSAVPAALAGLADFDAIEEPLERRVAALHGFGGGVSAWLFGWSWMLRRDHHVAGVAATWLASASATLTGTLGGHLAFGPTIEEPIEVRGAPGLTSDVVETDHGEVVG